MLCPRCSGQTRVKDSRHAGPREVTRRRVCRGCGYRFTTREVPIASDKVLVGRPAKKELTIEEMADRAALVGRTMTKLLARRAGDE